MFIHVHIHWHLLTSTRILCATLHRDLCTNDTMIRIMIVLLHSKPEINVCLPQCHCCVWLGDCAITGSQTLSCSLSGRWNAFCRCTGGRSYQEKSRCHLDMPISQGIIELYIYTHHIYTHIHNTCRVAHTNVHIHLYICVLICIYILWIRPNWPSSKGSKPCFQ